MTNTDTAEGVTLHIDLYEMHGRGWRVVFQAVGFRGEDLNYESESIKFNTGSFDEARLAVQQTVMRAMDQFQADGVIRPNLGIKKGVDGALSLFLIRKEFGDDRLPRT